MLISLKLVTYRPDFLELCVDVVIARPLIIIANHPKIAQVSYDTILKCSKIVCMFVGMYVCMYVYICMYECMYATLS